MITLTINDQSRSLGDIDPETPLLWALRDTLGLVGTKFGCGIAMCGACTVHIDGAPSRACQLQVGQLQGLAITTIEGIAPSADTLHVLQQAWIDHDVPQCGYCQAGQIMTAVALLKDNPKPTETEVRAYLEGNFCRCTGYHNIVKAIMAASGQDVSVNS